MPKQIEELNLSAARAGAITLLIRAKVYQSELDPKEMVGRFPEHNDDGFVFGEADFARNAAIGMSTCTRSGSEEVPAGLRQ